MMLNSRFELSKIEKKREFQYWVLNDHARCRICDWEQCVNSSLKLPERKRTGSRWGRLCRAGGQGGLSGRCRGLMSRRNCHIAHILQTSCTHIAHILHIYWAHLAHILHTSCTHLVHNLHTYCTRIEHTLHTFCTHLTHILRTSCTQIENTLHTSCAHLHTSCAHLAHIFYISCTYILVSSIFM